MRYVVYGAGAIGGVLAARLRQAGHDVAVIARGAHLAAILHDGLRLRDATGETVHRLPAVEDPAKLQLTSDDVVVLAMKTQDSEAALISLARSAPTTMPVVCAQNGVENERLALRRFSCVYGVCVVCPGTHLEPGLVQADSYPVTGVLDIGRFPGGADVLADRLAADFNSATYNARAVPDIARWKYRKLIRNLSNAIDVVCGVGCRVDELRSLAVAEGDACLRAAGIDAASDEEDQLRRGDLLDIGSGGAYARSGNSTWQSVTRGVGIETDYLNGEITLLGRLVGLPTPVNDTLQRLAKAVELGRREPGATTISEVAALARQAGQRRLPFDRQTTATTDVE